MVSSHIAIYMVSSDEALLDQRLQLRLISLVNQISSKTHMVAANSDC